MASSLEGLDAVQMMGTSAVQRRTVGSVSRPFQRLTALGHVRLEA